MKTNINTYVSMIFLLVAGVSCSDDFLEDMKNYGEYDDTFYQSEERVTAYIDNVYYDFFAAFTSPSSTVVGSYKTENSGMTEEIGGMQDLINPTLTFFNADDASGYYGTRLEDKVKNEPYHRIRDCNAFLEEIDIKGEKLDEEFRNRAKGQMYYLRALQYFDLMRVYGGVPVVTEVQTPSATDESIKLPRASVTEVVEQIVADFDMAASLLPENWEPADYGRFTKGAALAQKARVLLTYASPLFNSNWDSSERWQAALQAALEAESQLTADGYGLYGSSAKDWEEMFLVDNSFCSEAITVQLLGSGNLSNYLNNSWEQNIRLNSQDGGGGQSAPKEMIDLFPMADGSRPTAANGYDDFLFFLNRDPRFYRTFAFSGRKWGYKEDPESVVWAYRWLDSNDEAHFSDNNQLSSPAFVRKMTNKNVTGESGFEYSGTDIFEYRYAELLLNIAECYAGIGDLGNCTAYLGKVRQRVGIPSANNYGIGTLGSKYEAIEACLYERRVELAYEGKRFWDIQRWMLYNDDASAGNNTCAVLGMEPINGTQRTGHFLQYNGVSVADDPLAGMREDISVDPDAGDFEEQLQELAGFYTDNFVLEELITPMDNVNGDPVQIDWKQNYYIQGLNSSVLTQNDWLEQTIGWKDASGADGTYDYRE
ncbi:RagB/SusD family nutrient uptake outer membrane protein [Sinomicrobium pectinilyticum]|uniref:RagB/SusD family nutrient uptake outer membrane protein n=1 Tax=Sinomicrobium pectinilyticum TaxID=1084421 RepID=A0A3N0EN15_SINP1|nr:RagB/SusD family nutrient uptake outer membrane protein [Sinomicrobium pectinilyticum]RNL89296.1 RagB/SusD family nutrient uptake outer membrane protein [Sinomicrobium pectinilyticum]